MNMKNVLIYFRKDALLEQGNMPSQSRETCLPKAGKDTFLKYIKTFFIFIPFLFPLSLVSLSFS